MGFYPYAHLWFGWRLDVGEHPFPDLEDDQPSYLLGEALARLDPDAPKWPIDLREDGETWEEQRVRMGDGYDNLWGIANDDRSNREKLAGFAIVSLGSEGGEQWFGYAVRGFEHGASWDDADRVVVTEPSATQLSAAIRTIKESGAAMPDTVEPPCWWLTASYG